jgi:hypothetical protein
MAMLTLIAVRTIMLIILVMASDAGRSQYYFLVYRNIVAAAALDFLVFPIQFEIGFIVVKIPVFPVTCVVAFFTSSSKRAFMHILFLMTRPAI